MIQATLEEARKYFYAKATCSTGPIEVSHMEESDINTIDLRAEKDYLEGHIPGAKNLPQQKWDTLEGLDKNKLNILYCYSIVCHLAAKAGLQFAEKGFRVMEMDGGFAAWKKHHLQVETTKAA